MTTTVDTHVAAALAHYLKEKGLTTTESVPTGATPVAEDKPVVRGPIKLVEGEVLFSTLFGKAPVFGDFAVPVKDKAHEAMEGHLRSADPDYVVQIEEAARLVKALIAGDKTLITGPTGSGKSSLVKYVCAKMGLPFIRINMSGDIESSALFGQLTVKGGATEWVDGPLTEAVKYGGVVLIDEWELMPPEISMGMQNLLEDDGFLFLKEMPGTSVEKTISPVDGFHLVFAGNTVGQGDDSGDFSGTSVQNTATIDRFSTTIVLKYLTKAHEINVITSKSKIKKDVAKKMVDLAELIRNAKRQMQVNLTMSPRTLINWGRKVEMYDNNMRMAFDVAYYDKLRDSDKKAIDELYQKVFGRS